MLVYLKTSLGFWGQSQLQLWAGRDCIHTTAVCLLGRWDEAEEKKKKYLSAGWHHEAQSLAWCP